MADSKTVVSAVCSDSSVRLFGVSRIVKVLRVGSEPETFERVDRVEREINPRNIGQGRRRDFMGSILELRRAEFEASLVVVSGDGWTKEVKDAVEIEILAGVIEEIGSSNLRY